MAALFSEFDDILDARTPAEFAEDRVPGAINCPALDDDERRLVGALYKKDAFAARRQGAARAAQNIAALLQRPPLAEKPAGWKPLVYCWRGGQRSAALVEVMRRVGWPAQQLAGGYRAYRRGVMQALTAAPAGFQFRTLAGRTGAGKTALLREIAAQGGQTLDLERLAMHRGSAFGGEAEGQPTQKFFESQLAAAMRGFDAARPVFVESESAKIGALHLPRALLAAMRAAPVFEIAAELPLRAAHLARHYQALAQDGARFKAALLKISRYTGARRAARWQQMRDDGKFLPLAEEMLEKFYDVGYDRSLAKNYAGARAQLQTNPNDEAALRAAAAEILKRA